MLLTSQSWEVMAEKAVIRVRGFPGHFGLGCQGHFTAHQVVCHLPFVGQNAQPGASLGGGCCANSQLQGQPVAHQEAHGI